MEIADRQEYRWLVCGHGKYVSCCTGAIKKCYVTLVSWEFDPYPPPLNADNVEPYTFVTFFLGKLTPLSHHPPRYVTLEWPTRAGHSEFSATADATPMPHISTHWITRLRNPKPNLGWKSELGRDVILGLT